MARVARHLPHAKESMYVAVVPHLELERYESCGLPECIEEERNGLPGQRAADGEMTGSVSSSVPGCEGLQTARSSAITRLFEKRESQGDIRILQPFGDVIPCTADEHRGREITTVVQTAKDVEEDVIRQRGDVWRRDSHLVQVQMMPEGVPTSLISGTRAEVTVWRLQESRADRRSQYGT